MSATRQEFTKQQALASKKPSQLKDHEKMFLMRKEIDSLKMILRQTNNGSVKPTTSSSSSSSMDRAPLLTIFLFVGVLMVLVMRRKQRRAPSLLQNWNFPSTKSTRMLPLPILQEEEEEQVTLELQESFSALPNVQFV